MLSQPADFWYFHFSFSSILYIYKIVSSKCFSFSGSPTSSVLTRYYSVELSPWEKYILQVKSRKYSNWTKFLKRTHWSICDMAGIRLQQSMLYESNLTMQAHAEQQQANVCKDKQKFNKCKELDVSQRKQTQPNASKCKRMSANMTKSNLMRVNTTKCKQGSMPAQKGQVFSFCLCTFCCPYFPTYF